MFYREELLPKLSELIKSIQNDKKKKESIKNHFAVIHHVLPSEMVKVFNNPDDYLNEMDNRKLMLLTKQLMVVALPNDINIFRYFSEDELKDAQNYDATVFMKQFKLPHDIENAIPYAYVKSYDALVDIQTIKQLFESQVLFYDYEIQRELTLVKQKNGEYRKKPTIYQKNVDEICDYLLKGKLKPTTLIWNAVGEELYYDPKTLKLTIMEGTKFAILDGYHRINGMLKALNINPDLKFQFPVQFTQLSTAEACDLQNQIAKATPISKNRMVQLAQEKYSDTVVNRLNLESDLKDKISLSKSVSNLDEMLISYGKFSELIDKHFEIRSTRDARKVGDYLINFFNEIIGIYVDDFVTNMPKSRSYTLVNNARMFPGYVFLASKMYNEQIDVIELEDILKQIDFSRDNKLWINEKVLDEKGNLITHANSDKIIENIFDNLKLPVREV